MLFSICAFFFVAHARAISSTATVAAAAARSPGGAKEGMVLFSSAQQLQQQTSTVVASAAEPSAEPLVSSPGSPSESNGGTQPEVAPVVGEITAVNGQVESIHTRPKYDSIGHAL